MSESLRVAFQGEHGAFSEAAIHECVAADAVTLPCEEFAGIARALLDGDADLGMLPVENSIAGSVIPAYDILAGGQLCVVAELVRPIRLCLLARSGVHIDDIERVMSHPVALAQCQRYLRALNGAQIIAVHDTAGAARMVADSGDSVTAAVSPHAAAARYGLAILAEDIQDRADNQTRFYVVARPGTPPLARAAGDMLRTALMLETAHRAGALVDALTPFAAHAINLTRIESRPADEPWHYRFFVELDVDAAAPHARAALADVQARSHRVHVLGTFPRLSAGPVSRGAGVRV